MRTVCPAVPEQLAVKLPVEETELPPVKETLPKSIPVLLNVQLWAMAEEQGRTTNRVRLANNFKDICMVRC